MTRHSVHGLVAIEVEGAPRGGRSELERLFGPTSESGPGEPDIRVSYVDRLPRSPQLRYAGLHEAAFDERAFYLLDPEGRRMRIDLERLGEPLELVCERGMGLPPLLLHLVALRLLRKGHVLLHASAFEHRGTGILATGWQKGGKTELLLAFMAEGASFLGDEWTIVSPEDGLLGGLPTIAGIWDWHLRHLPGYWSRLTVAERARLRLLRAYRRLYRSAPLRGSPRGPAGELFRRLSLETGAPLVGQVRPLPERVFEGRVVRGRVPLDLVLFATMGDALAVRPVAPAEVASRMVASLARERRALAAAYEAFRFAFPARRSAVLEEAPELERRLLGAAFEGRRVHEVTHPYPVALPELYAAAAPLVP